VAQIVEEPPAAFFQPGYRSRPFISNQARANVDRGGRFDPAAFDDADFSRSTSEVDVHEGQTFFMAFDHRP